MTKRKTLFKADEMQLMEVKREWDANTLLCQEGIFFLKDVVALLNLDPLRVKRIARDMNDAGEDAYGKMGLRKVWNHWILRMKTFAPFYEMQLKPRVRELDPAWSGNDLIHQDGLFLLTDVCKLVPFSTSQLRYQAKRNPRSREEYGIWKDEELNVFVVNMEPFARWVTTLWAGKK